MKAALNLLGALVVAGSIGTTITIVVILSMLWWKGALADERLLDMLAALQGIQPPPPEAASSLDPKAEQPALEQLVLSRVRASLDLDLRENAIDKSLGELRTMEKSLESENARLDLWKRSFDERLAELQKATTDTALLEVQRTLEVIPVKQSKEQIMKMLDEPRTPDNDPREDVVRILKAMPLDKRKKILGEFKEGQEAETLHEILRDVRLGGSDSEALRDMRSRLQQVAP